MASAFPFPVSPSVGQTATLDSGQQMIWTGYSWEMALSAPWSSGTGWVMVSGLVDLEMVVMPSSIGKGWGLLNYV